MSTKESPTATIERQCDTIIMLERQLNRQSDYNELKNTTKKQAAIIDDLLQQVAFAKTESAKQQGDQNEVVENLNNKISVLKSNCHMLEKRARFDAQYQEHNNQIQGEMRDTITDLQKQLTDAQQQLTDAHYHHAYTQNKLDNNQKQSTCSEDSTTHDINETLTSRLTECEKTIDSLESTIKELSSEKTNLDARLESANRHNTDMQTIIRQLRKCHNDDVETIKTQSTFIKVVTEHVGKTDHGVVADLCKFITQQIV